MLIRIATKFFSTFLNKWLQIKSSSPITPQVTWPASIKFPSNTLELKGHFFAASGLSISTNIYAPISIGDKVMLGPDVKILGGNHSVDFKYGHIWDNQSHDSSSMGITIENGVWIGANCIILDGAYIGEGAIIGAGAVVTGYVPPWVIAAGVPAKTIRNRFSNKEDLKYALLSVDSKLSADEIYF